MPGEKEVSGLPLNFDGQVELVIKLVDENPGKCCESIFDNQAGNIESVEIIEEDDVHSLSITVINRASGKTATVSLIVPSSLDKGEYFLWTEEGTFDLGRC